MGPILAHIVAPLRAALVTLWLLLPNLALAHAHVFMQTAIAVFFDGHDAATGIRVRWRYA